MISAFQMGAGRVIAVDGHADRLARARGFGAETVNFNEEDPVEAIMSLTGGIGPDRAIDAVGVDAESASEGPAAPGEQGREQFEQERGQLIPESGRSDEQWKPGDAPSQALRWAVQSLAKAGTLTIIGVYSQGDPFFPIGDAMQKNLSINMGNCNHRRYVPRLVELVEFGLDRSHLRHLARGADGRRDRKPTRPSTCADRARSRSRSTLEPAGPASARAPGLSPASTGDPAMNPTRLSRELRTGRSPDLSRRRWIVGLSLFGAAMGGVVSAYQMGMVRRLPDPPVGPFDASKVDASDYAYKRMDVPDGLLMLTTYAATATLAGAGGERRAEEQPYLRS